MSLQRDLLRSRRLNSELDASPVPSPAAQAAKPPAGCLTNSGRAAAAGEAVHVAVRVRPPFKSESSQSVIVAMDPSRNTVNVEGRMEEQQIFFVDMPLWSCHGTALDGSFPVTQSTLYEQIGRPLLYHALEGFNSTLMAYGQTGSGKTYTMVGEIGQGVDDDDDKEVLNDSEEGIIPRLCRDMFQKFQDFSSCPHSKGTISWEVYVSFVEVYCEKISDLLDHGKSVSLRDEVIDNETYFSLSGARRIQATNATDVLQALRMGSKFRKTSSTSINERSSRSHAIFILDLTEVISFLDSDGETVKVPNKHLTIRLVDLAGSERLGETGVPGQTFKEGVEINLSLFTLGMVIESLTDSKRRGIRPPYRESTLTKLLKDAFGGNSKTTIICTIAPTVAHRSQTLQTLQYASKARRVVNRPRVVEDTTSMAIRRANEEVQALRKQLLEAKSGSQHRDALFQKLAEANERLRHEQEISCRHKLFLQQKKEELAACYREMEEERQAYDSRLRELGTEVERTKVKQRERERELHKARRGAEAVADERQKEMQLQRAALQRYLRQKLEAMLKIQQGAEERIRQFEGALRGRLGRLSQSVQTVKKELKRKEVDAAQREKTMLEEAACREEELQLKLFEAQSMAEKLQLKLGVTEADAMRGMSETQRERETKEGLSCVELDEELQETGTLKKYEEAMNILRRKEKFIQQREKELRDLEQQLEERKIEQEAKIRHREQELAMKMGEVEQFTFRERCATQCVQEEPQQALNCATCDFAWRVEGDEDARKINQHGGQSEGTFSGRRALLQRQETDTEAAEREVDRREEQEVEGDRLNSHFGGHAVADISPETCARSGAATMLEAGLKPRVASVDDDTEYRAACLRPDGGASCGSWDVSFLEGNLEVISTAQEDNERCFGPQQIQQVESDVKLNQMERKQNEGVQGENDICMVYFFWLQQQFIEMERRCRVLLETMHSSEHSLTKRLEIVTRASYKNDALDEVWNSMQGMDAFTLCSTEALLCNEGSAAENACFIQDIFHSDLWRCQREGGLNGKSEGVEACLQGSDMVDRENAAACRSAEEEDSVVFSEQLRKWELECCGCMRHMQPALVERTAVQVAEGIAIWEASERDRIGQACRLQMELHLCREASEGNFASAHKLLCMKEAEALKEEGKEERLRGRLAQSKADEAEGQNCAASGGQHINMYFFTGEEKKETVRRSNSEREDEHQHLREMGEHREELRKREAALERMFCHFQREAQMRERGLRQMEDQLRRKLVETERRVQRRVVDLERRHHEAASVANNNERTLKSQEADLQALLAKNKEIEKQIQLRDAELKRQLLHYVDLSKLLEDRERLLRREHAHRMSGKQSATQLTDDLLDVNELLKEQLKIWIQKYKVLKADAKVECERCLWQNERDATVCRCCGNAQLV